MDCEFVDMDCEIEREEGESVAEIFEQRGESEFRLLEAKMLSRIGKQSGNLVVATGGGVPCFGNNMETMRTLGVTIYFKMSPQKLAQRLHNGREKRPIIRGKSDSELLAFIEENLARREQFYSQASMIIDCDGVSDEYIVNHVCYYISAKPDVL